MGLSGDPVPPRIAKGAAGSRDEERPAAADESEELPRLIGGHVGIHQHLNGRRDAERVAERSLATLRPTSKAFDQVPAQANAVGAPRMAGERPALLLRRGHHDGDEHEREQAAKDPCGDDRATRHAAACRSGIASASLRSAA